MQGPLVPLEIKQVMWIENRNSHCSLQKQKTILLVPIKEQLKIADKETLRKIGRETGDLKLMLERAK